MPGEGPPSTTSLVAIRVVDGGPSPAMTVGAPQAHVLITWPCNSLALAMPTNVIRVLSDSVMVVEPPAYVASLNAVGAAAEP